MMKTDDPCPIVPWLEANGETRAAFIERTGVKERTFYSLLSREKRDYGILNLQRIEEGTGGQVTIRMILDWLNRKAIST